MAWDGLKHLTYGNNLNLNLSYNVQQQPAHYEVVGANQSIYLSANYQYSNDGRMSLASDLKYNIFDRSYSYDHAGRLMQSLSGTEARGGTTADGPYKQTYQYDVWGNLTGRANDRFWSQELGPPPTTYVNDRNTGSNWSYDVAGNVTHTTPWQHSFDAAGHKTQSSGAEQPPPYQILTTSYDGDGQHAKRVESRNDGVGLYTAFQSYYLRSSVLGGLVVVDLSASGQKQGGYVYARGEVLAVQGQNRVLWKHHKLGIGSSLLTDVSGVISGGEENDPLGALLGYSDPALSDPTPTYQEMAGSKSLYLEDGNPFDPGGGCTLDGMPVNCSEVQRLAQSGSITTDDGELVTTLVGGVVAIGTGHRINDGGDQRTLDSIRDTIWPDLADPTTPEQQAQSDPHNTLRQPYPCISMENLLKWEDLQVAMIKAWELTEKSGLEHAGWVIWDEQKREAFVYLSPLEGIREPNGQRFPTYDAAEPLRKSEYRIMTVFHTHPSGYRAAKVPSGDDHQYLFYQHIGLGILI
jgi:hypothetical protein